MGGGRDGRKEGRKESGKGRKGGRKGGRREGGRGGLALRSLGGGIDAPGLRHQTEQSFLFSVVITEYSLQGNFTFVQKRDLWRQNR